MNHLYMRNVQVYHEDFTLQLIISDAFLHLFFQNLPEANPVRMEETRKRSALMLQVLKEAAETNDNVARGFGSQNK